MDALENKEDMEENRGGARSMDRRSFVAKAGLIAGGAAIGGSVLGCSEFEISIPCLGPAPAPKPVSGMTYIRASQIGCALDCNLQDGRNKYTGGEATDDGPRINAAMASASANNPVTLIIDGSALISGLFLPAGGYWSIAGLGCGTGFFIRTGTNNDGIHNGDPNSAVPSDPGPPVPARGSRVALRNFTLNGNQGRGRNGDSTTGTRQGTNGVAWYFGINLMNLNDIVIENVVVVNTPAYHIRLSNVGNVGVSGCVLRSLGTNTDGLHFDGPANDISISNCEFLSGDDAIALNCPEGYSGNISRVTVTNCKFNSFTLMRLYTISGSGNPQKFNIDNVTVSNCSGTLTVAGFSIGDGSGSNPNSVTALTVSDCILTAPAVLDVTANFGSVVLRNIVLVPSDSARDPGLAFVRSAPVYGKMTYVGSSLILDQCTILRNGDTVSAALILENNSTILNFEFNGFTAGAQQLLKIESGSIGQLVLNSLDSSHIHAPVSPGGFSSIGLVSGRGVLATGWEFPDEVMTNGVPYISASTGKPSIKVDGVVESYP